jgi:hypothetical protein
MINTEDEIYKFIMSDSNMLLTPNAVSLKNATWSCIVTESYLRKLGYDDFTNVPFINYILPGNGDTDIYVPIHRRKVTTNTEIMNIKNCLKMRGF